MNKKEAIVDTCFLLKLSKEGSKISNIKTILDEMEYVPVIHPYVCDNEILNDGIKKLINEGYIRKINYDEFLPTEDDKKLYTDYYKQVYETMRQKLEAVKSSKTPRKLELKEGQTIFNIRYSGNSLGDVHMILMASFMQLPVILTEDRDIELLRSIVKKQVSFGGFTIEILCASDLIINLAQKETLLLSKKELETILDEIGERNKRKEFRNVWNESHPV